MQCVSPLSQCSIYAPASVETGFWEPALVVANAMEFINVMLRLLLHELAQKIGTSKPYGCCNAADQHGSMSGALTILLLLWMSLAVSARCARQHAG